MEKKIKYVEVVPLKEVKSIDKESFNKQHKFVTDAPEVKEFHFGLKSLPNSSDLCIFMEVNEDFYEVLDRLNDRYCKDKGTKYDFSDLPMYIEVYVCTNGKDILSLVLRDIETKEVVYMVNEQEVPIDERPDVVFYTVVGEISTIASKNVENQDLKHLGTDIKIVGYYICENNLSGSFKVQYPLEGKCYNYTDLLRNFGMEEDAGQSEVNCFGVGTEAELVIFNNGTIQVNPCKLYENANPKESTNNLNNEDCDCCCECCEECNVYTFEANFIRAELSVDGVRIPVNKMLIENIVSFDFLELVYLDKFTGEESCYSFQIHDDRDDSKYYDAFDELLFMYDLVDDKGIVHLDKLLTEARVDVGYSDGCLCYQSFKENL